MPARKTMLLIALLAGFAAGAPAAEISATSGAVGLEDRDRMMQSYGDYNLHLAFAQSDGAYLADVALTIRGADGRLLWRGVSEGPFFFARVPGGHYQVIAEFDGKVQTKRINVSSVPGPLHHFHWKVAAQ